MTESETMTEGETVPTWGYNADGAKLFDIVAGGKLPRGYVDSPAKVKAKASREPAQGDELQDGAEGQGGEE